MLATMNHSAWSDVLAGMASLAVLSGRGSSRTFPRRPLARRSRAGGKGSASGTRLLRRGAGSGQPGCRRLTVPATARRPATSSACMCWARSGRPSAPRNAAPGGLPAVPCGTRRAGRAAGPAAQGPARRGDRQAGADDTGGPGPGPPLDQLIGRVSAIRVRRRLTAAAAALVIGVAAGAGLQVLHARLAVTSAAAAPRWTSAGASAARRPGPGRPSGMRRGRGAPRRRSGSPASRREPAASCGSPMPAARASPPAARPSPRAASTPGIPRRCPRRPPACAASTSPRAASPGHRPRPVSMQCRRPADGAPGRTTDELGPARERTAGRLRGPGLRDLTPARMGNK